MKRSNTWGRWSKPVTPTKAVERRIAALPPMPEIEREEMIRRLCEEFGVEFETIRRGHGPY